MVKFSWSVIENLEKLKLFRSVGERSTFQNVQHNSTFQNNLLQSGFETQKFFSK